MIEQECPDGLSRLDPADLLVFYGASRLAGQPQPDTALVAWQADLVLMDDILDLSADEERTYLAATMLERRSEGYVLARADLYRWPYECDFDPRIAFDDTSAELASFVCLFDNEGEIHEQLIREVEPLGLDVLVMTSLEVAPAWRGRRLGPLLAAHAMGDLGRGCALVALEPMPLGLRREEPGYTEEQRRLERLWTRFGFKPWREGVFYLSVTTVTLQHTTDWLIQHAGTPGDEAAFQATHGQGAQIIRLPRH